MLSTAKNNTIYLCNVFFYLPASSVSIPMLHRGFVKLFASLVPMEQIVHVRDEGNIFRVDNTI